MLEQVGEGLDLQTLVPPGRRFVLPAMTILAALATLAAFAPLEYRGLAWVAPALLMLVLSQTRPASGFRHGWAFGTILMVGLISFARTYGLLPWLLLALLMGLFYGLFGLAASALRTTAPGYRVPALAAAWTLGEFLRGHVGSLSLTFGDLAYALHRFDDLPFIQIASLFGPYGVSFLMALLSAGLSCLLLAMLPVTWLRPPDFRRFNRDAGRVALLCFGLVLASYVWGRYTMGVGQANLSLALAHQPVRVVAVQAEGAVARRRGEASAVDDYTRMSMAQPADLIVWPETAINLPLNLAHGQRRALADLARRMNAHLLVGAGECRVPCTFNSAYFFRPDGTLVGTYRKMDLVMFGEYVPGRKCFPFLKRYPIRSSDYIAGSERVVFTARNGYTLSPLICFEGIFPDQTREVARLGAQLIVIITSDVWARGSNEVGVHSPLSVFRAIEARKYLVRAASVGVSAVYDPYGHALASVPAWQDGVAAATVTPLSGLSFYHRYGDWPLLAASLALLLAGLLRARRGSFIVRPPSHEGNPPDRSSNTSHRADGTPASREPGAP